MLKHASINALLLRAPQLPRPIFPCPSHQLRILKRMVRPHFPTRGTPHHRIPPSHQWATWTKFGKVLTPCNHKLQPAPPFPRRDYLTCPTYTSAITWSTPPKNRITRAPTLFSCMHMPSRASPPAIKRVGSPSPPIEATRTWLYSTSSMPTIFSQYPSRTGQKKNSCMPTTAKSTGG